jgi:putative aldouronate transport system substrate-binding protein
MQMKQRLYVLTAALVTAIVFALSLGACAKSQTRGGVQQNMENLNVTGLPIVKEKESFTMLIDDDNPEKRLYDRFEAETNVHVNLMVYPHHVAAERKGILIASGDYPDVIAGWIVGSDDILSLAEEGVLVPLEDLIDQYTVNIKEVLDMPGIRERMTLPDGHIYSPPYVIEEPLATFHPWINSKWLKQLGLEMPTTTEEFKNVLIAFRDRIPPVNGQKIIPFSWDPYQLNIGILAGWFGVVAQNFFAIIDGQLEITINRPEFREYLKYLADLYANGLMDPELFTQDKPAWKAKGMQGLYGAAYCYWPDDFAPKVTQDITVNQWDYEPLPVLRGPGVAKPVYKRNCFGTTLFGAQMMITDKATNPITILRWLDYVYEEEKSLETLYGPIGYRFEKLPDGSYREIDTTSWSEAEMEQFKATKASWTGSLPVYRRPGHKVLPPEGQKPPYDIKAVSDALYEPYLEPEIVSSRWLDRKTSQEMAVISQPIGMLYRQKVAEWVSGQTSIDAEWDDYVAQLEKLGIQKLLQLNREHR